MRGRDAREGFAPTDTREARRVWVVLRLCNDDRLGAAFGKHSRLDAQHDDAKDSHTVDVVGFVDEAAEQKTERDAEHHCGVLHLELILQQCQVRGIPVPCGLSSTCPTEHAASMPAGEWVPIRRAYTDTVCHLLVCSALQYPCIEDIVSANPTMTVPVTKCVPVVCQLERAYNIGRAARVSESCVALKAVWLFTRATRRASQVVLVGAEHECEPRQADDRAGQVGEAWQEE
eukprot:scaffold61839_cov69-Phaeocystis_antarctica.AAC.7